MQRLWGKKACPVVRVTHTVIRVVGAQRVRGYAIEVREVEEKCCIFYR